MTTNTDYDPQALTAEVMAAFGKCQDPRTRELMVALVKHLHAFAVEVDLKPGEWLKGLDFLTRTGQISTERRPEFILLSDVLGLSMMVVSLAHARSAESLQGVTEATVEGPFYWPDAPEIDQGGDIAVGIKGEPCLYTGRVTDAQGTPLAGALLDIWSGDGEGWYDVQLSATPTMAARGRLRTDAEGRYRFWSIRPFYYPIPTDGPVGELMRGTDRGINRPGHIHMMVTAEGHAPLTTHLFVANSPYLHEDAVFGKRDSLVVDFIEHAPGTAPDGRVLDRPWFTAAYDFRLARAAG
jgi:hydroxyquinol 1,2-dioxygenase